jgi:3',5'-cyclic-AMP phosphodiesterase
MLIVQITDTHVTRPGEQAYGVVDTATCLERAVAALNALDPLPDLAVVTGDLVDRGEAEEYAHLRVLLAPLRMPVVVIAGNHDSREELRTAFAADGYLPRDGFLHFTIDDYPLRLVALDTLVPGQGGGTLCAERLAWLDQALAAAPDRPTVVLMHHPPFATGIAGMDRIGLVGAAEFAGIARRHPQVERILCGHLHRAIAARFAGTLAGTAPSTAHQLMLDIDRDLPPRFTLEPAGYQLHQWRQDAGLVTHTALIGDWPGPYPFSRRKPPNE